MSTPLRTGIYIIQNYGQNLFIGRNLYEDLSLRPKQVISLPPGVAAPKWIIEELPNGTYILRIGGDITGEYEKKVWAFLIPQEHPTEWLIKPSNINSPNTYFITNKDGQAWSLPTNEPFTQIPIGLDGVKDDNKAWRIIRLDREE